MYYVQPKWGELAIVKTQNENPWYSLTKSCPIKVMTIQLTIIEGKINK